MVNEKDILISVIVPVYNAEKYLDRCINSIASQSHQNLEILLINDGSTDHSLDICHNWRERDRRIKVFDTKNQGASSARNVGLRNMSGQYVGFADSDDEIKADMYEKILRRMYDECAEVGVCTDLFLEEDGSVISQTKVNEKQLYDQEILRSFFNLRIPGGVCNKLFLSNIILQNELRFDGDIVYNEDFLFTAKYCAYAHCCCLINEPLYLYYNHSDSVTHIKDEFNIQRITCVVAARRISEFVVERGMVSLQEDARFYISLKASEVLLEIALYPIDAEKRNIKRSLQIELRNKLFYLLGNKNISIKYKILSIMAAYNFGVLKFLLQLRLKYSTLKRLARFR